MFLIHASTRPQAVDDDAEIPNNVIEYAIMKAEPDNNIFDINADTGEIMLKSYIKSMAIIQNITKQTDFTWSLLVQARDLGQPSFSTTAVVKIDITEAVSSNKVQAICTVCQPKSIHVQVFLRIKVLIEKHKNILPTYNVKFLF